MRRTAALALVFAGLAAGGTALALPGQKWAEVDPQIRDWILTLHAKGSQAWCCSLADGEFTQQDIRKGADGDVHWFVYAEEKWREVPDEAIVDGPNLLGRPMVWIGYWDGDYQVRCFMPGALG